jgi:hypothetical protein
MFFLCSEQVSHRCCIEKYLHKSFLEFDLYWKYVLVETICLIYILKYKLNFIAMIQQRNFLKYPYSLFDTQSSNLLEFKTYILLIFCIIQLLKWQKVTF